MRNTDPIHFLMRTLDLVAIAVSIAFGVTVTLWLAPLMWSDLRVAISSFVWPTTNATVIEHRITQFGGRAGWTYLAAAEFVYELSGQVHRGSEVLCECRSASDAADVLAKYPKGRVSIVSYDPARPSLARPMR